MSWGTSEFNGETSYDSYFTTPAGHNGVTFVASSGDSGATELAVGGVQRSGGRRNDAHAQLLRRLLQRNGLERQRRRHQQI